MGLRLAQVRLPAGRFSGQALAILKALKRYGLIVADNGSDMFISGTPDRRWNDDVLDQLKTVPPGPELSQPAASTADQQIRTALTTRRNHLSPRNPRSSPRSRRPSRSPSHGPASSTWSEGLRDSVGEFTDHYVKLQLPPPGALPLGTLRPGADPRKPRQGPMASAAHPHRCGMPTRRPARSRSISSPTVPDSPDPGPATPPRRPDPVDRAGWRLHADPEADWHLLATGTTPRFPRSSPPCAGSLPQSRLWSCSRSKRAGAARARREAGHRRRRGDLRITWLHRCGAGHSDEPRILNLIERLDLPEGRARAFVHGEAGMVREVRKAPGQRTRHGPGRLSATGYWKFRRTEEGWREDKPE